MKYKYANTNFASQDSAVQFSATANRFYKSVRPFANEPTRNRIAIVGTIEKGQGVVSLVDIKKGEIVFRFHGETLPYQTLFTLQKAPGKYVEDPHVMGKVLHSCEPNMHCDMETQTFTATRAIRAGEFLTMDYDTTEDELFRAFDCGCGTEKCRGFIGGRVKSVEQKTA